MSTYIEAYAATATQDGHGVPWVDVAQAAGGADDLAASVTEGARMSSQRLNLTGFGLSLPVGATPEGIEVTISAENLDGTWAEGRLWSWIIGDDATESEVKGSDVLPAGNERVECVLGGPTEMWGLSGAAIGPALKVIFKADAVAHDCIVGAYWVKTRVYCKDAVLPTIPLPTRANVVPSRSSATISPAASRATPTGNTDAEIGGAPSAVIPTGKTEARL